MSEAVTQPEEGALEVFISYLRAPFSAMGTVFQMMFWPTLVAFVAIIFGARKVQNFIAWAWAAGICWFNGIDIDVEGLENLPEEGSILLFNHSSFFDVMVMYSKIRKEFRFGAKEELFRTPFLGWALHSMGALSIRRASRSHALKLYEDSVPRIQRGESFALAPEGTRQEIDAIGRFKTGPFIFGTQSGAMMVPVVIKGAREIMPKGKFFINPGRLRRRVCMRILPAISAKDYTVEDFPKLQEKCRNAMVEAYDKII